MEFTAKINIAGKTFKLLSFEEFKQLKNISTSNQTLDYAIKSDRLDFVRIGKTRFIVMNRKAEHYSVEKRKKNV